MQPFTSPVRTANSRASRCFFHAALGLAALAVCAPSHAQQTTSPGRFRPVAFRIGPNFSPDAGLSLGLDFTAPRAGIAPGFATRITLESGFVTRGSGLLPEYTVGIFTLDQLYQKPGSVRAPYVGAGLGLYEGPFGSRFSGGGFFGSFTSYDTGARLGGKIFVGADFTSTTSVEATMHFAGSGAFGSIQLRLKL